jgi:glycosyltransferase involved in cell wall biosynthesis
LENIVKKYLVSAIISTYNSESFIRGKLEDLLDQTISNQMEIIVVNSGSQQDEHSIIHEYLNNFSNIKYIHTSSRETIYKAWNKGIKISSGKYITNANTDDRLRKDAFEILSSKLAENPEVALVYADQYITNEANVPFEFLKVKKIVKMPDFDYVLQLDRCLVFSQPMWRASLHFEDKIWFNEKLEICGDHEFELHLSLKYKMLHIPIVLGSFYLATDKSNKSYKNINLVKIERDLISYDYMRKYLERLSEQEKINILNKFLFYTKIPIPIFLILLKFRQLLLKKEHTFFLEFTYLFTSVILEYLNRSVEAINVCEKFLLKRRSVNIARHLNKLKEKYLYQSNKSKKNTFY